MHAESASSFPASKARKPRNVLGRLFALFYFIALACVIGYVWLLARDGYVTTATFKVSKQDAPAGNPGLAQLALPGLADSGSVDAQLAIGFITSADLLLELEKEFKLVSHYSSPERDFVFRMDPDAPLEARLEYYRKHLVASFDKETGLTTLTVRTFDPALARDVAAAVIERAEVFVNGLNQKIADQQLGFARHEVEQASNHVNQVGQELIAFQNEHRLISPDEVISASLQAVQELRMERLRAETELASILRDSPGSPRIESIHSRLRSLDQLIAKESLKLAGPEQDRLNQVLARFRELQLKLEFASNMRRGAELLLEKTRVEAVVNSRFFSVLQQPFLPEDAAWPRRGYATATILGAGILLFLILRVLARSVYDRKD